MQCKSCNSQWETGKKVSKCPFCGQSLQIEKSPDEIDISDVISYVISNLGYEALKNKTLVNSYVKDFVKAHDRDKKLFRIILNYDVLEGAYQIITATDAADKEILTKKQFKLLTDEAFLSEDAAVEALNIVLRGIGVEEFSTAEIPAESSSVSRNISAEKTAGKEKQVCPAPASGGSNQKNNKIDSYSKYVCVLEDYFINLGRKALTKAQIEDFLKIHSKDLCFKVTFADVQKDLIGIYAKNVSNNTNPPAKVVPLPKVKRPLYSLHRQICSYDDYIDELEQCVINNGKKALETSEIIEFLDAYDLRKKFGIKVEDAEIDMFEILKKY